jgi:hypothetical protein
MSAQTLGTIAAVATAILLAVFGLGQLSAGGYQRRVAPRPNEPLSSDNSGIWIDGSTVSVDGGHDASNDCQQDSSDGGDSGDSCSDGGSDSGGGDAGGGDGGGGGGD